ncbi:CALCIUM-BINDING PROTEIN CML48-RELATED [Salix viminalis]|uniref:CALCIUM-BINDING PROTEIN CML48-RELATED n=1 Tax=Salix viminalis TaxID=40686 RepID=A0A9Q0V443_SALVM|nr:CALCIUM-BINDING PROTEIN CML48-RELATED [Salix viminalis]
MATLTNKQATATANPQPQPYGSAAPYSSPYGAPPQPSDPYGAAPQPAAAAYGAPQPAAAYGAAQPAAPYGSPYGAPPPGTKPPKDKPQASAPGGYPSAPGGYPSAPYGAPPPGTKPPKDKPQASAPGGYPSAPYGSSPFAALLPSTFPPGTDPSIIACFQVADQDGSGIIDDKELQRALSSYNQSFSLRTVHLLMYLFTNTNTRMIGPKEFSPLFYSLQNWRANFERFDRDRSGRIDINELREALMSLGFAVSPVVLDLLVSKFDKTGGKSKAIEYDNFIECCLTVKGLTDKFKERDTAYSGSASFRL